MHDDISSAINWLFANKEWVFSGVGVFILTALGTCIIVIWRVWSNIDHANSVKPDPDEHARIFRPDALDSVLSFPLRFYRWSVERIWAIRRTFVEKKERRRRRLYRAMRDSTVFFSHRFAEAFPGCRGIQEISDPADAVRRLDILLRKPLTVCIEHKGGMRGATPMWWIRGGEHMHIYSYNRIRKYLWLRTNDILLNDVDLHRIRRVVGIGSTAYWANAVYVETDGVSPSGVYKYELSDYAKRVGYEREEVGVYKGKFVTREEYDDGAAILDGKPIRISGKVKLQVRYLTPYNFLIIPIASPVNDSQYDEMFENALRAVLERKMGISGLADLVRKLRRNPREDLMSSTDV